MRIRTLTGLALAAFMLAACGSSSDETATTSGQGQTVQPQAQVQGQQLGAQEELVQQYGDRVFFDFDSSELTSEGRARADGWAQFLSQRPGTTVTVEGHCDERGTREYNLALGERRAASVRNYLLALGVDPNRVATISYGKERPAVLGSNEFAWAQNRRGVMVVN